jgi:hypothetical protein
MAQQVHYMSREEQASIVNAQNTLREVGYEFRLWGASRNAWDWMPQYRKAGDPWQNIPGAVEQVDWKAQEVLESFQMTLVKDIERNLYLSYCVQLDI